MSLSKKIRDLVDKETEELNEEIAGEISAVIKKAIQDSTGEDLDEILEDYKGMKIDTPLGKITPSMLTPESLQAVLERGHKRCLIAATNSDERATLDILIGRELAKDQDIIAAVMSMVDFGPTSTLL